MCYEFHSRLILVQSCPNNAKWSYATAPSPCFWTFLLVCRGCISGDATLSLHPSRLLENALYPWYIIVTSRVSHNNIICMHMHLQRVWHVINYAVQGTFEISLHGSVNILPTLNLQSWHHILMEDTCRQSSCHANTSGTHMHHTTIMYYKAQTCMHSCAYSCHRILQFTKGRLLQIWSWVIISVGAFKQRLKCMYSV